MKESSTKSLRTLWKKEKLLVTSNFSFSHSVFKRLVLQTRKNQGLFGKGLRILAFVRKNVGEKDKQKMLLTNISPRSFQPIQRQLKSFNPFPNKPLLLHLYNTSLLKTQWEKEKLPVTSHFSFSYSILYPSKKLSAIYIIF